LRERESERERAIEFEREIFIGVVFEEERGDEGGWRGEAAPALTRPRLSPSLRPFSPFPGPHELESINRVEGAGSGEDLGRERGKEKWN
jgi:hypothetical protein